MRAATETFATYTRTSGWPGQSKIVSGVKSPRNRRSYVVVTLLVRGSVNDSLLHEELSWESWKRSSEYMMEHVVRLEADKDKTCWHSPVL